jgi:hypothetical protein
LYVCLAICFSFFCLCVWKTKHYFHSAREQVMTPSKSPARRSVSSCAREMPGASGLLTFLPQRCVSSTPTVWRSMKHATNVSAENSVAFLILMFLKVIHLYLT